MIIEIVESEMMKDDYTCVCVHRKDIAYEFIKCKRIEKAEYPEQQMIIIKLKYLPLPSRHPLPLPIEHLADKQIVIFRRVKRELVSL